MASTRIVKINRLHDVSGEKEFERPVGQNSDLAFQTGQFAQINPAP